MHPLLANLIHSFSFTGSPEQDAPAFLFHHGCPHTAKHSQQVAQTAARLARQYQLNPAHAALAGWLHDISAVIPNSERLPAARQLGLEVLPQEAEVPLLLHQKISAEIAKELFGVEETSILEAICCHTTLRAAPAPLETLLFVADKLAWDQKGQSPYAAALEEALNRSLDEAAWVYQNYLWHSGKIKIIHPWMEASYRELKNRFAPH